MVTSSKIEYNVKNTTLNLIRAWGCAFQGSSSGLPNFGRTLDFLQRKSVSFPAASDDSNYSPPICPPSVMDSRPGSANRAPPPNQYNPEPHPRNLVTYNFPGAQVHYQPRNQYPPQNQYAQNQYQPHPVYNQHAPPQNSAPRTITLQQLNELLSSQGLLRELLLSTNAQDENVKDNELITELLETCKAQQPQIVESVSTVTNEELLTKMLQFNDQMIDLNQIFDDLAHCYQTRASVPRQQVPSPTQQRVTHKPRTSSFTGINEAVTLDLPVNYESPFLPPVPVPERYDDSDALPSPNDYVPPKPNPIPQFGQLSISETQPSSQPKQNASDDFDAFFDQIATRDSSKPSPSPTNPNPPGSSNLLDILSQPVQPPTTSSFPMGSPQPPANVFPNFSPQMPMSQQYGQQYGHPNQFMNSPPQSSNFMGQPQNTSGFSMGFPMGGLPSQSSVPQNNTTSNSQNQQGTPDVFRDLLL